MQASWQKHAETHTIDNRSYAHEFAKKIAKAKTDPKVETLSKFIEIRNPSSGAYEIVNYESRAFKEELELVAAKFELQKFT